MYYILQTSQIYSYGEMPLKICPTVLENQQQESPYALFEFLLGIGQHLLLQFNPNGNIPYMTASPPNHKST